MPKEFTKTSGDKKHGGNNQKRVAKIFVLAIVIIGIMAASYYFRDIAVTVPKTTSPTPEEFSEKTSQSIADPILLNGLWRGDNVYPYPRFLEITDKGFCSSWSSFTNEDYSCLEYTPYTVQGNFLILHNVPLFEWDITDNKLVLTSTGSTTKEVYERVATSTIPRAATQSPAPSPNTLAPKNL